MNLLIEGKEIKAVIPSNIFKKLVINNNSQTYQVHKIRIDLLYFNEQNDRIATWISKYKIDNKVDDFDFSDIEKYNNLIHNFITESNPKALKDTQTNIKILTQQEPGVVLSDGRIIDGNRRFTCLRNIERETGRTQYFDAVILDHDIKNNAKEIKMLELMLQHGVDEKIDYNPIDKLVGIYTDIIATNLLTVKEYADSVNQTEAEINQDIEKAKLLVEFLEFLNAPNHFYLARELSITESLKDLHGMLKKVKNEDEREDLKNIVFAQLLMQPVGDMNRYIRKIKKIVDSKKYINSFIDEQTEIVEKVCDEIENHPKVTSEEVRKIRGNEVIRGDFKHSTEKFINKADAETIRNYPAKLAEKAHDTLDSIDLNIFKKMTTEEKETIRETLDSLDEILSNIRRALDV
jgi:hypothetical protein